MKPGIVAVALGLSLLATPALAQTADQTAAICDFLQTGMIHYDTNFSHMIAGPADASGAYPLARPYSWPDAACSIRKDSGRWHADCAWALDGVTTADQAGRVLDAVGDNVTACIGGGYKASRTQEGMLVFALGRKERVNALVTPGEGRYLLTLVVLGPG